MPRTLLEMKRAYRGCLHENIGLNNTLQITVARDEFCNQAQRK